MGMLRLKATMIGTLAAIIGLSTLFFTVVLALLNVFDFWLLGIFVVGFNFLQWLIAPYLIDAMYRVRKITKVEEPELYRTVERISQRSNIKIPEIVVARIPIPNAFAYGSPLTGKKVAVTTGLLDTLDAEEVEAVIGHEIGHLKHRDVQVMMFASILPALFYYIGYSLVWSSALGRRDDRGSGGLMAIIGLASILFYWILTLFTLYLSRLREYYADRHSTSVVDDGSRKLSEGLAKIAYSTEMARKTRKYKTNMSSMKSLFISDPDTVATDAREMAQIGMSRSDRELVERYLNRKISSGDRLIEIFSTHPNMVKRLRTLQESG